MNSLSVREKQVAGFLALGKTEKEIAGELFISTDTVHTHKKNIFKKLGARSVVDVTRTLISEVIQINITELIRKEIVGEDLQKFCTMLLFICLQVVAMNNGLDERRTRLRTKTVTVRISSARKSNSDLF